MKKSRHKPVLLKESIHYLKVRSGIYVDLTLGGGGHTKGIIKALGMKEGKILCFDMDIDAVKRFEEYIIDNSWNKDNSTFKKNNIEIILINRNFEYLNQELQNLKISKIDGIIADLGLSNDQINDTRRGFSYMNDSELDMRMDKRLNVKAKDLVNGLYEKELEEIFKRQDERFAKRIAKAIIKERNKNPINTTLHLVQTIQKVLPFQTKGRSKSSSRAIVGPYWKKPVQRVFQALRIAVNSELSSLRKMLPQAIEALATGGRLIVISFHSGEDRIVKVHFKEAERKKLVKIINKKPISPTIKEINENYRASSAKMRVIEKI